jgi:hypothetical protein
MDSGGTPQRIGGGHFLDEGDGLGVGCVGPRWAGRKA